MDAQATSGSAKHASQGPDTGSGLKEDAKSRIDAATSAALEALDDVGATGRDLAGQAAERVSGVAKAASAQASDLYDRAGDLLDKGRRRYPSAEHAYRTGRDTVAGQVHESPIAALFVAGAVGYALAWLLHSRS